MSMSAGESLESVGRKPSNPATSCGSRIAESLQATGMCFVRSPRIAELVEQATRDWALFFASDTKNQFSAEPGELESLTF